jgi:hypothetical protein
MVTLNGQDMQAALLSSSLGATIEMADCPYSNSDHAEPYDSKNPVRNLRLQGRFKGTVTEITTFVTAIDALINCATTVGDGAQSKHAAWALVTGAEDIPAGKTYHVTVSRVDWDAQVEDNRKFVGYSISMIERPAAALE